MGKPWLRSLLEKSESVISSRDPSDTKQKQSKQLNLPKQDNLFKSYNRDKDNFKSEISIA